MANITANTKKYGQITLNTKPHSYPHGDVKFHVRYTTPTSHISISQLKQKPSKSYQRDVNELTKMYQILSQVATVRRVAL